MRLCFLGDISCPEGISPSVEGMRGDEFQFSVVNLEGAIRSTASSPGRAGWAYRLYNQHAVLGHLQNLNVRVVSLANNHILDESKSPSGTIRMLAQEGMAACGAGDTLEEAAKPAVVRCRDKILCFMSFGWEAIQCVAAERSRPGVNPLRPAHLLRMVALARRENPDALIVVLVHWGYELELYPQPMHRQLAFQAVDAGANAIVGHHPHCAQGIEFHHGVPIVYSLGNWFLPNGSWFGRHLSYPDYVRRQLVFEWDLDNGSSFCRWFLYSEEGHRLVC